MECESSAHTLGGIFQDTSIWINGLICDLLLDLIVLLVFKLTSIERMIPSRKGNMDDVSQFLKLCSDPSFQAMVQMERAWIGNNTSATDNLIRSLKDLDGKLVLTIFEVIFDFLQKTVRNSK